MALGCVAWFAVAAWVLSWLLEETDGWLGMIALGGWGIASIAALFGLLTIPGAIMRHLPEHASVWWVVAGGVAVIGFIGWCAYAQEWAGWWFAVPTGAVVVGVGLGAANDALNRVAASIPMSLQGLVALLILGTVAMIAWMRKA